MQKTYNTHFAKETGYSDQTIKSIEIKLAENGLTWSSKWVDITECFSVVNAPLFAQKLAIAIRQELMHEETIMLPDGYNGDMIKCHAEPIAQDKNSYKLRVYNSYLTKWVSKEMYNIS